MKAKKWALTVIALTAAAALLFGAVEFLLDPLLQYGGERGPLTYREYSEMYSNPGIAKNYSYNAVLLGSSMVENTDVSELNRLFGCTTIKVPYSGGSSFNHRTILDVCYRAGKQIDYVFWSLDEYALTTEADKPRYPLPTYLYDDSRFNDLCYLLNLDIFYFYTLKDLYGTLTHRSGIMMRDGSWVADESIYCRENALASIKYPMEQKDSKGELLYGERLADNLKYNILPMIEEHPETEFRFYLVPYSISYWYQSRQNGTLDAELYAARKAIGEILHHDNARVYFFQDETEIITDLDLYKDYTHFKPEINSWMSQEMAQGTHLLTKENYGQTLDAFRSFLASFDYDGFYA